MIPWGFAVLAFIFGGWFGLLLAGLLQAAAWADEIIETQGYQPSVDVELKHPPRGGSNIIPEAYLPWRREGTE